MSEPYTPTTDEVRECWATAEVNPDGYTSEGLPVPDETEQYAEFDRWLARVKADALRQAANTDEPDFHIEVALAGSDYVRDWLNARADRIEAGR